MTLFLDQQPSCLWKGAMDMGHYSRLAADDEHTLPPPYTPTDTHLSSSSSTQNNSRAVEPYIATSAPCNPAPHVSALQLQPALQNVSHAGWHHPAPNAQQQPLLLPHTTYLSSQMPQCSTTPLILRQPPTRIENLKTKPDLVVCQHCHHLVLTETTHENGKASSNDIGSFYLPVD